MPNCSVCGEAMRMDRGSHRYDESGLDNVLLVGIPLFECKNGHKDVVIPDPAGLHRTISLKLIQHPLTPKALRFLRKELGMTAQQFAEVLNVDRVTVSRWENDLERIGKSSDQLIRLIFLRMLEEKSKRYCEEVTLEDLRQDTPAETIRVTEEDVRKLACR